jgi:hypothetical protein
MSQHTADSHSDKTIKKHPADVLYWLRTAGDDPARALPVYAQTTLERLRSQIQTLPAFRLAEERREGNFKPSPLSDQQTSQDRSTCR